MKKISIFGKSTVEKSSFDYQLIESLSYQLVEKNYTCVHGGYAGGIMQAVADGAYRACIDFDKSMTQYNIGVPEERFDEQWPRVPQSHFTNAAVDIYDRLRTITESDIFIVSSKGGDGTLLESDIVIHENCINQLLGKPTKPIIFLENDDKKWSQLFQVRLDNLDISKRNMADYPWVHFINISDKTIDENIHEIFLKLH